MLPEAAHIAGKAEQQAIERSHQHLKGRFGPQAASSGLKRLHAAQVVCVGHGFMRNLRDGFYRLGFVWHGPDQPHRPRLQTAWEELTARWEGVVAAPPSRLATPSAPNRLRP